MMSLALALCLAAAPKTQLKIEVKPETAVIYVDGKKQGTGAEPVVLDVKPGKHVVKIVNNLDEHEEEVSVKKGEAKTYQWAFEDDRRPTGESGGAPIELSP